MIKVILFDCDGVIIKERGQYFSQRLAQELGLPINENFVKEFFKKEFLLCETGKADLKEELQKKIGTWGYTGSVDELIRYWFEGEAELVPAVVEKIKGLRNRGIKCFVSTNNEKYRTEYLWNVVGLKNFMDGIFSSSFLGVFKSDLEFWQKAFEQLPDYDKLEVLVVDNNEQMLKKAKEFGFQTEFYENFEDFKKVMNEKYKLNV